MKDLILKHALLNAIEHSGRADVRAVLGKTIAENPELKDEIKEVIADVKKIVEEVNSLSLEDQRKRIRAMKIEVKRKKIEEKYELPELPNMKIGKVVTAFPPEPSKFPHLGHAKAALINFLYAKKYKGRFILRFEDSNPELAKKEYYEAILNGLTWLGIKWNKMDFLSDHLPEYYKIVELLIKNGDAYVCLCKQEEIKHKRAIGEECEHRDYSKDKNIELWKNMLKKFREGESTVRLKIDMKHKNALMRDPSIVRIIDAAHPRTKKKFRVWPTYDFGTAMLDIWEKVTHRVRSKEFELRKELQQYIQKILRKPSPYITEIGRFNIQGVPSSGRIIREMIKNEELSGWDDPRLTTLMALKRRGFTPEGIKNFLLSTGVTKAEAVLDWDPLESENRKIVDPIANRYFAIINPKLIDIRNPPKVKEIKARLHPNFPKRGSRKIYVNVKKIYIDMNDFEKFKGREIRLMDLFNIRLGENVDYTDEEVKPETPKMNWVSAPNVKLKIVMPDGSVKTALGEKNIKKLKKDELIQLMRIGFCRVDDNKKETVLYFTHK
jgi:glutamyl-tRNA synthetase